MLESLATLLTRWCTRYVPDGYVIALVLTTLVFAAAVLAGQPPLAAITAWGDGFWGFIPFTLQMSMIVLTGFLVADAPIVRRGLARLALWPTTPRRAVALTAAVSMSLAWVNWGLSIVASAILARRIGARRIGADYRLLVACAYLGLGCLWHAGLSASAPLTSSDPSQAFVKKYLGGPVPITETVFSAFNLGLAAIVLVVMTSAAAAMCPRGVSDSAPEATNDEDPPSPAPPPETPAERLQASRLPNLVLTALVLLYLPQVIAKDGLARVNINHVNLLFLGLGAFLHGTPASLLASAERGGAYVWGVLLQFGLYAGVAGLLDASGLAAKIAERMTGISTPSTFPLLVVWYSGVLNYLVPSGGAKWFIEVQYLAEASRALSVPMAKTLVAYAWGDMLTDIIQPFWAIPLLAVARLGFRDIMGYCLALFLVYAAVVSCGFVAYGFL